MQQELHRLERMMALVSEAIQKKDADLDDKNKTEDDNQHSGTNAQILIRHQYTILLSASFLPQGPGGYCKTLYTHTHLFLQVDCIENVLGLDHTAPSANQNSACC